MLMTKGAIVYDAGNTLGQKTGDWRKATPTVSEKCIKCGRCVIFCPEGCMTIGDKRAVPNLEYCKGCGICAKVCPVKAIIMADEK